jgi:hypothetical protein
LLKSGKKVESAGKAEKGEVEQAFSSHQSSAEERADLKLCLQRGKSIKMMFASVIDIVSWFNLRRNFPRNIPRLERQNPMVMR